MSRSQSEPDTLNFPTTIVNIIMNSKLFWIFGILVVASGVLLVVYNIGKLDGNISTSWDVDLVSMTNHNSRLRAGINNIINLERKSKTPPYTNSSPNQIETLDKEVVTQGETETGISFFREKFRKWYNANPPMELDASEDKVLNSSKYFIYRCDASTGCCGGWADRVKGVIVSYLIANLTGRVFKLEMLKPPCDLTQLLTPNLVNWSLPYSFHTIVRKAPNTKFIDMLDNQPFYHNVSHINFTEMIGREDFDYIYFKANLDYMKGLKKTTVYMNELSWMKDLSPDQILAILFKRLFKPNPILQSELEVFLDKILPTPKHKLICAHIRMGRNPTIPGDTASRNKMEHMKIVWKFLNQQSKDEFHKVFLMSDSEQVVNESLKQNFSDRVVITPGKIVHVDRSRLVVAEERCRGLKKVIFDQFVLMNCDVLMISHSGLSRVSAYVRGSNKGLFCLMKDGSIVPCTTSKINDLYKILG